MGIFRVYFFLILSCCLISCAGNHDGFVPNDDKGKPVEECPPGSSDPKCVEPPPAPLPDFLKEPAFYDNDLRFFKHPGLLKVKSLNSLCGNTACTPDVMKQFDVEINPATVTMTLAQGEMITQGFTLQNDTAQNLDDVDVDLEDFYQLKDGMYTAVENPAELESYVAKNWKHLEKKSSGAWVNVEAPEMLLKNDADSLKGYFLFPETLSDEGFMPQGPVVIKSGKSAKQDSTQSLVINVKFTTPYTNVVEYAREPAAKILFNMESPDKQFQLILDSVAYMYTNGKLMPDTAFYRGYLTVGSIKKIIYLSSESFLQGGEVELEVRVTATTNSTVVTLSEAGNINKSTLPAPFPKGASTSPYPLLMLPRDQELNVTFYKSSYTFEEFTVTENSLSASGVLSQNILFDTNFEICNNTLDGLNAQSIKVSKGASFFCLMDDTVLQYFPPDTSPDFSTQILPGQFKTIVNFIKPVPGTENGSYFGRMVFRSKDHVVGDVPVSLTVHPVPFVKPWQAVGMWYRLPFFYSGKMNVGLMKNDFNLMLENGFNFIGMNNIYDENNVSDRTLDLLSGKGLNDGLRFDQYTMNYNKNIDLKTLTANSISKFGSNLPVFAGTDEPFNDLRMKAHLEMMAEMKNKFGSLGLEMPTLISNSGRSVLERVLDTQCDCQNVASDTQTIKTICTDRALETPNACASDTLWDAAVMTRFTLSCPTPGGWTCKDKNLSAQYCQNYNSYQFINECFYEDGKYMANDGTLLDPLTDIWHSSISATSNMTCQMDATGKNIIYDSISRDLNTIIDARRADFEGEQVEARQRHIKEEKFYFQSYFEHPQLNRTYFGFFLFNSRLDGAMAFTYNWSYPGMGDPFVESPQMPTVEMRTVYPAKGTSIPTYQFMGLGQGAIDLRWAATVNTQFKKAYDKFCTNKTSSSCQQIKTLCQSFNTKLARFDEPAYYDGNEPYYYNTDRAACNANAAKVLYAHDYDRMRSDLKDMSMELYNMGVTVEDGEEEVKTWVCDGF
ncbi:hypothetical protein K1X76_05640 [bacterium]|nr:hypothetical protein [bacterium]